MSATPDPSPTGENPALAAAQLAATAAAKRLVASTDASYDERTDLIADLRTTTAQLEAAEKAEREAGR